MSVLEILHFPDHRLRKVAVPVKEVNKEIENIVDDMLDTMYAEKGIGLAATQVDIHQCIIVIDISNNCNQSLVLINPQLIYRQGDERREEGCLSIPEQYAFIPRATTVKVRALSINGTYFELKASNLLAACIQHEMDHLVGKLFVDYLSPLKRQRIQKKLWKTTKLNTRK